MDQRTHDQGRHERFAELYAAHYRPLVAFCRRLVGREAEAEELAQEAFLRAWASWDRYAPARPFWPWVSTIARRLCIDHGRRLRTARQKAISAASREAHVPSPEELVETEAEYRWARAALDELRPDHRRVLRLREVEGWSYDQIADHEGVTVESVRGSLRRARVGLRTAYARIISSSPIIFVFALARGLRRHASEAVQRLQNAAASGGPIAPRAGDAVAALLALALGTGAAAVPLAAGSVPARPGAGGGSSAVTEIHENGSGGSLVAAGTHASTTTTAKAASSSAGEGKTRPDGDNHPLPVTVPGQGPSRPEGSNIQSFTPSPNYGDDHIVYASGVAARECAVRCPFVLFRSTDGGDSWTRLRSVDYPGGTVMLSPSYPNDARIFVISPNSLRVSQDDGLTYRPLTPLGGFAAMSPGFSSDDRQILVGAMPGWIYHDETAAVTPFDKVPESATSAALSFAYSPAYPADGRLLVGGTASPSMGASVVSVCRGTDCTPPAPLVGSTDTPAVYAAKSYATSGLAFAWHVDRLYRSLNGGVTFAPLSTPTHARVQGIVDDAAGNLYLAQQSGSTGGLFVSHDRGTTWTRLGAGTPLENGALAVTPLPGGRILAAPYAQTGAGLLCSSDGGHSWAPRCSS